MKGFGNSAAQLKFKETLQMMKQLKNHILFCIATLMFLASAQISFGHSPEKDLLEQPVRMLNVNAENIFSALSEIVSKCKVPIGFESALEGNENLEVHINIRKGSLRDVLDAIVEQDYRYEWKLTDGVINIYPKVRRDDFLRDLLNTQVHQFNIMKGTSRFSIRVGITDLPEIKAKLEDKKISRDIAAWTNADYVEASPGFILSMSDATVREILNQIIKTSEAKFWALRRTGEGYQFLNLNL
jgi:hypothetical protein